MGGPTRDLGPTADVLDDGGVRGLTVTALNREVTPAGGGGPASITQRPQGVGVSTAPGLGDAAELDEARGDEALVFDLGALVDPPEAEIAPVPPPASAALPAAGLAALGAARTRRAGA